MLTSDDKVVYLTLLTVAGTIGALSSLIIIWLLYSSKFDNMYNICIFGMSAGLFIYNIVAMFFCYYPEENDITLFLLILGAWASLICYYLSSLLSISIYFLLKSQFPIPWLNLKYLLPTVAIIAVILIGFLGIVLLEESDPFYQKYVLYNLSSMTVKIILIFINFITYMMCEYLLKTNYNMTYKEESNINSNDSISRKYAAITMVVRRMRYYPMLQAVSTIPYYIWGFANNKFINFYYGYQDKEDLASDSFVLMSLLLDPFWMLLVYLAMNPNAKIKITKFVCCLCNLDSSNDGLLQGSFNSSQPEFDSYAKDSESVASIRTKSATEALPTYDLKSSIPDREYLESLSEKDLVAIAEGTWRGSA